MTNAQSALRITSSITVGNLFRLISQMQRDIAQDAQDERHTQESSDVEAAESALAGEPGARALSLKLVFQSLKLLFQTSESRLALHSKLLCI